MRSRSGELDIVSTQVNACLRSPLRDLVDFSKRALFWGSWARKATRILLHRAYGSYTFPPIAHHTSWPCWKMGRKW